MSAGCTSAVESIRQRQLQAILQHIYAYGDVDKSKSDCVREYIDHCTGASIDGIENLSRYVENPHCLTRFYPYANQDIAIVGEAPRISSNGDINKPETTRLAGVSPTPEVMSQISAQHYTSWFAYERGNSRHGGKFAPYFAILASELPQLGLNNIAETAQAYADGEIGPDAPEDLERWYDYFQTLPEETYDKFSSLNVKTPELKLSKGFYGDFYVTNTHKMGVDNSDGLDAVEWTEQIELTVADELNAADPTLTIALGGEAWEELRTRWELTPRSQNQKPVSGTITEVHGFGYERPDGSAVIPLCHPSYGNRGDNDFYSRNSEYMHRFREACSNIK